MNNMDNQLVKYFMNKWHVMEEVDFFNSAYLNKPIDLGNGQIFNIFDLHILERIVYFPGILMTTLAQQCNYSECATSKAVTRLEKRGLIYKGNSPENKKKKPLFPTEFGLEINKLHDQFDYKDFDRTIRFLLERHTSEELEIFLKVSDSYICIENPNYKDYSYEKNFDDISDDILK